MVLSLRRPTVAGSLEKPLDSAGTCGALCRFTAVPRGPFVISASQRNYEKYCAEERAQLAAFASEVNGMAMGFAQLFGRSHKRAGSSARLARYMPSAGLQGFSLSQLTDPEQSEEFRNFVRYCDASMCLFDIGASYGAFSLVAAHFGGTAIAVEPSPIATRFIRVECQLNGFGKKIRIVEACAGEMIGEVEMLVLESSQMATFEWLWAIQ